jgi:hypothetical protein
MRKRSTNPVTDPIKIFDYIAELDAFRVTDEYQRYARRIGLDDEWNLVVFIGRYFALDNDFGEHWMDNFELIDEIDAAKARDLGYNIEELYVIDPKRFQDGRDGPWHTDEQRKKFWTDVLSSFTLSRQFLRSEAKEAKEAEKS